ncbi:hypothetical protein PT015_23125 [Candidatus Mycobacterium wuenschmannii]|uniref:Transmembrane protein n=1 Tax=Candidatus Mycobacterium wuenschmannii TaxID=3027808 RepID=A0ABY8VYA0_9MYCO|nr:hypothetical protein [Candidatus Mycobacterium wuenschmannii]WIM87687.1 hypothetical protein PT015_23125 [Candidatus Mycobacterium wuenschmannii]
MLTILRRTVSLWWQTWPWLVAIYLIGWFLRYWAIHLAIQIAFSHGDFWGSLVLPLAPLVRLLMYLAMFLVIRSAAPGLQGVETDGEQAKGVFDVVMTAILPFLVIYTAWKLLVEDYYVYVTSVTHALLNDWKTAAAHEIYGSAIGPKLWLAILIAFVLRQLMTRFRERLPRWTMIVAAYLEVVWLYFALKASAVLLFGSPQWIRERRIVVWLGTVRDAALAHVAWLAHIWNTAGTVLGAMISVVALALAWLAIGAAIYGTPFRPTWASARRVLLGERAATVVSSAIERGRHAAQPRWQRVPAEIRRRAGEFARSQLGRFGPIADAWRLILHGGALPIAFFVLAYTALVLLAPNGAYWDAKVTDGYLWRGVALLIGPHDWPWWQTYDQLIRALIGAVVDPLRISLVAATYWFCVDRVRVEATREEAAGDHTPDDELSSVETDHE